MKKSNFYLASILILGLSSMFSSCKKDDTNAPIITLVGDSEITLDLQTPYQELGATAIDDEDGELIVEISGDVDINLKGVYTITYTATDEAGNIAIEDRIVNIVNSADFLAGNYINAKDSCGPDTLNEQALFNATVTTSNTDNGKFSISNFGAFNIPANPPQPGEIATINLIYNKQTNKITPADLPQNLTGGASLTTVYPSSGVLSLSSPVSFKIVYEWRDSANLSDDCTSTYTK
jgi:hypothetical protein